MAIEKLEEQENITVVMKENDKEIFLPNVIATDFDDKYYRFYLAMYNPKIVDNEILMINKTDGQLGSVGLPYVFIKSQVKYIIRRFVSDCY